MNDDINPVYTQVNWMLEKIEHLINQATTLKIKKKHKKRRKRLIKELEKLQQDLEVLLFNEETLLSDDDFGYEHDECDDADWWKYS